MTALTSTPALRQTLATVADEGVETEEEQLLLWLIRNQFGVGAEDSYASLLYGTQPFDNAPLDAIVVTTRRDVVSPAYILFETDSHRLRARVEQLTTALLADRSPESRIANSSVQLRSLFEPTANRRIDTEPNRLILCVTTDNVGASTRRSLVAAAKQVADVEVVDFRFLASLADADQAPTRSIPDVRVEVAPRSTLDLAMEDSPGIVTAVHAEEIANWPGIDDRTLFDLNVRYALGLNRVRRSLDEALQSEDTADDFIAYHNGITAICRDFAIKGNQLVIHGMSVVNGAQTVVAIKANEQDLAKNIRILLKLVKTGPDTELARNIAVRSNTQNPVTSRNLRALDDVQARLQADLGALGWVYARRPNDNEASGRVIRNDDVAQLMCSIYVQKPTLAVKRQVLFEQPLYSEIFPSDIEPSRLIFATTLRSEVEKHKPEVPIVYQKAWALTALTLVGMAANAMRHDRDGLAILEHPQDVIKDLPKLQDIIAPFVEAATQVLVERAAAHDASQTPDDFKVAFKQARTLSDLATRAAKQYRQMQVGR